MKKVEDQKVQRIRILEPDGTIKSYLVLYHFEPQVEEKKSHEEG